MEFWTIEILGEYDATLWHDAHGSALIEAAITHGAKEWSWVVLGWGRVFEVAFADEADWLRFRATPVVRAALDAVPDPVNGLLIYSGRGGSSSTRQPRRPRPAPRSGAAELPRPEPSLYAASHTELHPEPGLLTV